MKESRNKNDNHQEQNPSHRAATLPESKPINSTRLRRFLILTAVKLLKRIRPHQGTVLFVSDNLCIKFAPLRHLPEASTIQFISEHTSIPVPKIYCAFAHTGWTYIAMGRIKGEAKLLLQLKKMVEEMRSIPPPQGQGVSNVDGGPIHWPPPVFTHGDLSSLNVLVREDQIVGIIDWETAGWYPSYWEYTTAWQIDKFQEPMPAELEMEMIRLKDFGDV
ncbi:Protein kinase-like domain containing protein [Hyaloscypha variabilis]